MYQGAFFAAPLKTRGNFKRENYTGERLIELLVADSASSARRIAEVHFASAEALDDQKVIEVPEDDGRKRQLSKFRRFFLETSRRQDILACRFDHIAGFGSIARDTA